MQTINSRQTVRWKDWHFWCGIAICFCLFSVFGHWIEIGYCSLIKWGILPGAYDENSGVWRDLLFPFCVYGVGFIACVLLLEPLKEFLQRKVPYASLCLVTSFLVNAMVCCAIELAMGMMLNQPLPDGSMPLWDYRGMVCNFMGQICLQNGVAFGLLSTFTVWVLAPFVKKLLSNLDDELVIVSFVFSITGTVALLL